MCQVGCRVVSEGEVRIISHKGKDLIKAELANKLYKAEIKFNVGRGKPQALIKGDAPVRCQDFFCEVKHHHPLHTLKENQESCGSSRKGRQPFIFRLLQATRPLLRASFC